MRLAGRKSAKVALRVCRCPCLRPVVGESGALLWLREGVREADRVTWAPSSANNTGRSYACTDRV